MCASGILLSLAGSSDSRGVQEKSLLLSFHLLSHTDNTGNQILDKHTISMLFFFFAVREREERKFYLCFIGAVTSH